jgi:CubicO group peptidase (beta-lactamase class C family)
MLTPLLKTLCSTFIVAATLVGGLSAAENYAQLAAASVKSYLAEHPYAAVTVGIIDTQGAHVFGFGQLKKDELASKPDGKTIYQIGSITKIFTTTMLAEQVALGHMKLDDPAQKYLPTNIVLPREKDREITLEELATHYSGLPRLPQLFLLFLIGAGSGEDPYALLSWEQLGQMLPDVWLSSAIGAKYNYSNLGMGLLGQAMVNATKSVSYADLVAKRIVEPLGLVDTRITLSDTQRTRLAQAQLSGGTKTVPWYFDSLEGCGALYSTVDDLLVFASANLGLRKSNLAIAMQFAQEPCPERRWPGGPMGLGWHIMQAEDSANPSRVWHNGMTGGYASMLILVPDRKVAIVVLSNVAASVDEPALKIAAMLAKSQNQDAVKNEVDD